MTAYSKLDNSIFSWKFPNTFSKFVWVFVNKVHRHKWPQFDIGKLTI